MRGKPAWYLGTHSSTLKKSNLDFLLDFTCHKCAHSNVDIDTGSNFPGIASQFTTQNLGFAMKFCIASQFTTQNLGFAMKFCIASQFTTQNLGFAMKFCNCVTNIFAKHVVPAGAITQFVELFRRICYTRWVK